MAHAIPHSILSYELVRLNTLVNVHAYGCKVVMHNASVIVA